MNLHDVQIASWLSISLETGRKQYSKPRVHPLHCVEHNTLRTRSAQQIGPRANQPPNNTWVFSDEEKLEEKACSSMRRAFIDGEVAVQHNKFTRVKQFAKEKLAPEKEKIDSDRKPNSGSCHITRE